MANPPSDETDAVVLRAVQAAGGYQALADRLGIRAPSVFNWKRVPPLRVLAVEEATGIPRHELRPDIYPPPLTLPPRPAPRRHSRAAAE